MQKTYDSTITKDWWGINELPLSLGVIKTILVTWSVLNILKFHPFWIAIFIGFKVHVKQVIFCVNLTSIWGFQTRSFHILVFIHKAKLRSGFIFHKNIGMSTMDVEAIDVFFNLTMANTQFMSKGGQDKNSTPLQVFIEELTKHVVVVLHAYASTSDCTYCLSIVSILERVDSFWKQC